MIKKKITGLLFITIIFLMGTIGAIDKIKCTCKSIDDTSEISIKNGYKFFKAGLLGAKDVSIFKEQYIEINGLFQRIIDKKVIEDVDPDNKVIKLNNGSLTFVFGEDDMNIRINDIIKFNEFLKDKNIPCLYIQAPHKIDKYNNELPRGIDNYANIVADDFLKGLDGKVNFIDIREEMHKDQLDYEEYFFRTDHHWTPEGAFYAFTKVTNKLNNDYGFSINKKYLDSNNYDKKILEKWFLGSEGKRVGTLYAGVDDISIISPKFETNFDFSIDSKNIHRKGKWLDTVVIDRSDEGRNYYNSNPYSMYMNGDEDLKIVKNHNSDNDKKILIVRDSFGCAFSPFLSLTCKELDEMDMRHYKGSLYDYVEKTKPDIVLFLFNPTGIQYIK